jgi:hypothetical protein
MENIHIGKLIHQKLKEIDRSKAWLARQICYDPSSFCKLLKRNYMDTELLLRISLILNYDFFTVYSDFIRAKKNENHKEKVMS